MTWQKLDDHCHRGQSAALEIRCMKELAKTIDEPENQHESTYALLMRSEEKSRNLLEVLIYPFFWQFVLQAVDLPSMDTKAALRVTSTSGLHPS